MALITRNLAIVVNDMETRRITPGLFLSIMQEAVNTGDILLAENEMTVMTVVIPLLDEGLLKPSVHSQEFEKLMNIRAKAMLAEIRRKESAKIARRWWQIWK
jgi:hypothetical protein